MVTTPQVSTTDRERDRLLADAGLHEAQHHLVTCKIKLYDAKQNLARAHVDNDMVNITNLEQAFYAAEDAVTLATAMLEIAQRAYDRAFAFKDGSKSFNPLDMITLYATYGLGAFPQADGNWRVPNEEDYLLQRHIFKQISIPNNSVWGRHSTQASKTAGRRYVSTLDSCRRPPSPTLQQLSIYTFSSLFFNELKNKQEKLK